MLVTVLACHEDAENVSNIPFHSSSLSHGHQHNYVTNITASNWGYGSCAFILEDFLPLRLTHTYSIEDRPLLHRVIAERVVRFYPEDRLFSFNLIFVRIVRFDHYDRLLSTLEIVRFGLDRLL